MNRAARRRAGLLAAQTAASVAGNPYAADLFANLGALDLDPEAVAAHGPVRAAFDAANTHPTVCAARARVSDRRANEEWIASVAALARRSARGA